MSSKARVSGTLALTIILTIGFIVSGFAVGNAKETGECESVAAAADDADCRWVARANDQIDGLTASLIDGSDRSEFLYVAAEPHADLSASGDDLFAVIAVSVDR